MSISVMTIYAQNPRNTLSIEMKDGTNISYLLEDLPVISFANDKLLIKTKNLKTEHPQAVIKRYVFISEGALVKNVGVNNIKQIGDLININGLDTGTLVYVYSIEGKLLMVKSPEINGTVVISLSALPLGMYIIKYSNLSVKIFKS